MFISSSYITVINEVLDVDTEAHKHFCNIVYNFARNWFEKLVTTEIVTCSLLNFGWPRRNDKWWYDYTYDMKWYLWCYIITILMGRCIGTMNHNQYLQYCQLIFDSFFTIQQGSIQMESKMKIFSITGMYLVLLTSHIAIVRHLISFVFD